MRKKNRIAKSELQNVPSEDLLTELLKRVSKQEATCLFIEIDYDANCAINQEIYKMHNVSSGLKVNTHPIVKI